MFSPYLKALKLDVSRDLSIKKSQGWKLIHFFLNIVRRYLCTDLQNWLNLIICGAKFCFFVLIDHSALIFFLQHAIFSIPSPVEFVAEFACFHCLEDWFPPESLYHATVLLVRNRDSLGYVHIAMLKKSLTFNIRPAVSQN